MRAMSHVTRVSMLASVVALTIGCEGKSGSGFHVDPWSRPAVTAGGGDASAEAGNSDGGGFPGFGGAGGLQQIIETVMENVKKPGPYEAPDHGAGYAKDKPHWGVVDLSGSIVEREAYSFSLLGGGARGTELRALAHRFDELAASPQLVGLVARVDGLDVSLPDAIELRATLHAFRDKGKKLVCFTEGVSGVTYLVMTACERIVLAPLGDVVIAGPAAMPIHIKPLLDRFGVTADFLHVGAYKGAAEPLTRDAPSPEMQEVLGQILDRMYQSMVDIIAADRAIAADDVKKLVDEAMFDPKAAVAAKLADETTTWEAARDAAAGDTWTEMSLEGDDPGNAVAMVKAMEFLGMAPPAKPIGPHVALVYAVGDVVDGGGGGVLGARSEIASGTLVAAIRALTADDDVKAVVVRIDSGGGSALASELIWHAMAELKAKKPVVVSMSDVAASGGYYIAAGATKIFALPDTLTGSIGVVGGKLAFGPALDRFGVKTYPIGRGKRATMFASLAAWSADEKAAVQKSMTNVYDVFKSRVAAGRGKTVDQIEPIAQGHIWTGAKAKELGLVDELGGLDAAVAEAAKLAGVDPKTDLEVYPPAPTLRDFVHGFGGVSAGSVGSVVSMMTATIGGAELDAAIALLPATVADEVKRLFGVVAAFQADPIQARAFVPAMSRW
jgi:protease IV